MKSTMLMKNHIEFLSFSDGTLRLYETDENDEIIPLKRKLYCFGERTIGVKRYYAARQNDIELNKVIHIQRDNRVTTDLAAVIGRTRYKIEQVQHMSDSNPPSTVLSLSQVGLYEGEENVV